MNLDGKGTDAAHTPADYQDRLGGKCCIPW